jgi:uroporphyrinogen decarboxylase
MGSLVHQSLYLQAARGQETTRAPIWMMRQAGRYMQSFRDLRTRHSFMTILRTPELAVEVTLQPIKAFGMDAAILFSDILVIADALDCGLDYIDQQGPVISKPIRHIKDIEKLPLEAIEEKLEYVFKAVKLAKAELAPLGIPLIGFAGAPFTLASYLMGDGVRHDLGQFLKIYYTQPDLVTRLMEVLTKVTTRYLNALIEAGVDALQIFDSWTNVLNWSLFHQLSSTYLRQIIDNLKRPADLPVTVFGTANSVFYPLLEDSGVDVISFDSKISLAHVRSHLPHHLAIQGNLDPYFLLAPRSVLKKEVLSILNSMKFHKGFIFNLSHGVLPSTSEDQVKFVVDLVQNSH